MAGQPEILSLAASILAAVVPRWKASARAGSDGNAAHDLLNGATVFVVVDSAGIVKHISVNAQHVLGEASERAAEFRLTLAELLQPEQRQEIDSVLHRFTRTASGETFCIELLTRSPSGTPRWLEIWCRNLLDKSEVSGFLLEIRDTTLRKSDDTLRALLTGSLTALADSVIVTDVNGVVQYVNPAFEKMSGYGAPEIIGRTPVLLKSGRHRADFYEQMWNTLSTGETFREEVTNRSKNGELYTEDLHITPVRDAAGTITHFVSVGRDVTERKRLEAEFDDRAYYDAATGTSTPRLLIERSKSILALARRYGRSVGLLHIEVAGLPSREDSRASSEVLRRLGERLQHGLRESDAVARVRSDQFLVLLSEVGEPESTARIARRLRKMIHKPFRLADRVVNLAASMGVALEELASAWSSSSVGKPT
jgi:PAS domain S-box-containing protein/diguanylate cyclase (GGDEF)-like protein